MTFRWNILLMGQEPSENAVEREVQLADMSAYRIDGELFMGGTRFEGFNDPILVLQSCENALTNINAVLHYYEHEFHDVFATSVVMELAAGKEAIRHVVQRSISGVASSHSIGYSRPFRSPPICIQMVSVSEHMHDFGWAVKAFNENRYNFVNLYITYDYLRRCLHKKPKEATQYIVNQGFASQDELDHFRDTANNYRHAKNSLARAEMHVADAMLLMMKLIESIAIDRFRALNL